MEYRCRARFFELMYVGGIHKVLINNARALKVQVRVDHLDTMRLRSQCGSLHGL